MIRRAKGLELLNYFFVAHFSTFGSKVFLTLKIMDFKNVGSTKKIHIYVTKSMNALYIYDIKSNFIQILFIY
jgi:hypothetical protein